MTFFGTVSVTNIIVVNYKNCVKKCLQRYMCEKILHFVALVYPFYVGTSYSYRSI